MNVYLYYVVSMFVNDVWFRKGDTRVQIVKICIVWRF